MPRSKWFCNECGIKSDTEYCGKCGRDCDFADVRKSAERFKEKMAAAKSGEVKR